MLQLGLQPKMTIGIYAINCRGASCEQNQFSNASAWSLPTLQMAYCTACAFG
jgi:hypothetical protein